MKPGETLVWLTAWVATSLAPAQDLPPASAPPADVATQSESTQRRERAISPRVRRHARVPVVSCAMLFAGIRAYLRKRAGQGFTVVQAVVLAEFDGPMVPNAHGHLPLRNNDPRQPNEGYFQHVDGIVNQAAALGIYVGLLPTWGHK